MKIIRPVARRVACLSGFGAAAVIAISALITGIVYRGLSGERYSFLNHYISELGELGVSELAPVFNLGLVTGGMCFAIFMVALGLCVRSWGMYVICGIGLVAAVGLTFVGILPIGEGQSLELHTIAAATFFLSGLIFTLLFALYVLFSRQAPFPKWLATPSALTALTFLAFLVLPGLLGEKLGAVHYAAGPSGDSRPAFWLAPFLEWLVLFAMTGWTITVSSYLMIANPCNPRRPDQDARRRAASART